MKLGIQTQISISNINLYKLEIQKPHSVDFTTTCYNTSKPLSLTISIDNES